MFSKASLMKSVLVVAVAAMVAGAGVAQAVPIELAVNGGLETGDFTGWAQFPSGAGQQTIISPGATGTYAGCIQNQIDGTASLVKNANVGVGVVTPGQVVTISFKARGAGANGGVAFAEFFSEIDGGGTSASVLLGGAPLALDADPNVWKTFNFVTNAGPVVSGGVTLQLNAVTGANIGSTSTLYFDDISITVDSPVAVEPTSWSQIKADSK